MTSTSGLDVAARIASARSLLFVPGDRPDRIGKALVSGADAVIIDLEDAVRPDSKQYARSVLADAGDRAAAPHPLHSPQPLLLVRVNAFGSPDFADDTVVALASGVDGVVLPKFVPGREADEVDAAVCAVEARLGRAGRIPLIGIVESAAGLLGLSRSVELPSRVLRLAFGAADYHADLRISYRPAGVHTDFAMATLVVASAAAGLAEPLDSPYFALDDDEGLAAAARRARDLGFGGALCIHPKQLDIVNSEFGVRDAERSWAERVVEAWNAPSSAGRGAIRVGDELVDEAMVRRARQILDLLTG
jgi:citrate lyase subunit beta/citryl-CoA lyase